MESNGRKLTCLRNVKSLTLLYKIANVLCVAPIFDFEKGACVRSTWYNYYAFAVFIVVIGVSVYSLYGRFMVVYPNLVATNVFIDAASYIMTTIANGVAIIKLSIWKNEDFKLFLVTLESFDKTINYNSIMSGKRNYGLYIEMFVYHLFLLAFCIYDAVVWVSTLGISSYRNYVFRYFQYYQLMTVCFLIYNYVTVIKHRFEYVNNKLENCINISSKVSIITDLALKKRLANNIPEINCIRDIANLYTALCDIIELFNKIFGFIILMFATNIILGLLHPLNLALVYSIPGNPHIQGINYGAELAGLCLFWAALYMMFGVILAASCDLATKEAKKTGFLCYKLTQEISACSQPQDVKDDLILFAQLATNQAPYFTAAGFFNVDYTMLLSILGSVTAYIVVLIQFNKE